MASLFSFLFRGQAPLIDESGSMETQEGDPILSFEALADEVEILKEEFQRYRESFEEASVFISQQQARINRLTAEVNARNATIAEQTAHIKDLKNSQAQSNGEIHRLRIQALSKDKLMKKIKDEVIDTRNQLAVSHHKHGELVRQKVLLSDALRLEEQRPKAGYVGPNKWLDAYSVKPFVAVLVDGDAYSWSKDIFKMVKLAGAGASAGSVAALRLRKRVQNHIVLNSNIPASCEIVARVFWNGGERMKMQRKPYADVGILERFMVDFTRDVPLFDYFDSGAGKEQADTKIRVNFELFVTNPHCHAVFLAVCTDNGFARMLRPYQHDPVARQKIILVSAGYRAPEIVGLPFEFVQWPDVFHPQIKGQALPRNMKNNPVRPVSKVNLFIAEMVFGMVGVRPGFARSRLARNQRASFKTFCRSTPDTTKALPDMASTSLEDVD